MMRLLANFALTLLFCAVASAKTDFNRDIRPILSNTCFVCHGPDEAQRKAKLRLDVRENAIERRAIVPGKPDQSEAFKRLISKDPDEKMPPAEFPHTLTAEQISTVRQWITEGAEYKAHWAYEKPQRAAPPAVKSTKWPRNAIDNFILARLEREGLLPQPEADRYSLIRRVSLDLTGLPPTPAEADAFVADKAPDAYERVVDRLLATPAFGEHQARGWLDLARYADSAGYADDPSRSIWAYRDYVIRSFNANKPFDQFTIEQIAGDLLPNPSDEQLIATAFHRNTMTNNEGGTDDEEFRTAAVVDRVNTTMSVWMGTSMACAQCHTHKYDPITQTEYFRMLAFFNNTADADKRDESPLHSFLSEEQKAQRAAWETERAEVDAKLNNPSPAIVTAAEKWAREFPLNLDWQPLKSAAQKAQSGAVMTTRDDASIIVAGGAKTDNYTLELPITASKLTALRLETVPDETLPGKGPGHAAGNFVVTRVRASLQTPQAQGGPKARFVRIELPGKDRLLQVAEVQIFSGNENIALRGAASQSSTYAGAEAKRAIDSNTAGEYDKNSVAHTSEGDANVWWEVDLKSEQTLDRVVIWNRTELPERLQGFRVVALDEKRQTVWEKSGNEAPPISATFALSGARDLKFVEAVADFTQPEFDAKDVLGAPGDKKDTKRGWAIGGAIGQAHTLSLLTEQPVEVPAGARLIVTIEQQSPSENHTLGRFRLSASADTRAGENLRTPPPILAALAAPPDKARTETLNRYYTRQIAPELKPEREKIATLARQIETLAPTTVPILRDLEAGKRRKTQVQIRGSHLILGDEVSEGVPVAFNPLPQGAPMNRLTFANWLADENNPLTARVIANRFWEDIFGIGLVRTSEEFGAQGEMPSHPELLDYLATELVKNKWNTKQFLKMLVTSAAYRQSSRVTAQLLEKDPENRLLARGPRFRMTGETVRDQALFVGGLLSRKMYGVPVRPIRPSFGLNAAFGGGLDWQTSAGEDRHRRALYTELRRTSPYPSLTTFDAPNREVCTVRRGRTNTPLQALVTMNDPVFIEAAQSLARRMVAIAGTPAERVNFGIRACLTRPARDNEVQRLLGLHAESLALYKTKPEKARDMATNPIGAAPPNTDIADLAAWTTVANVLLNLDETLMKR